VTTLYINFVHENGSVITDWKCILQASDHFTVVTDSRRTQKPTGWLVNNHDVE